MPRLSDHLARRARSIDFTALGYWLPNPDPILRERGGRIEIYRELRSDAHVGGCIRRRKSAVKALEWGLDRGQARSRVAKEIESLFADLDLERLIGDCLEATLYGYQPLEILWKKAGALVVPGDVIAKPPEWFHFDADNTLRFRTRDNPFHGEELPPLKFLLPRQDATYQNPYGFADLSMVFWPIVFKKGGVRFWLSFAEKFGSAFSVGKLPRSATAEERATLLDALEALIQDGVATIPDDGSVELVEMAGKAASTELYERLVMYCRSEVSIALTGTNQTTEANSNKASASAGLEVADDLRDGDAEIVAAAVNKLIRWTVDLNWSGAEAPRFELWDQEARDLTQAARDKSNYDAGARFTNAYWMREYGYQEGDLAEPAAPSPPDPAPSPPAPLPEGEGRQIPSLPFRGRERGWGLGDGRVAVDPEKPEFADASSPLPLGEGQGVSVQGRGVRVQDAADRLTPALADAADAQVGRWLADIEDMLAAADSLEQFREQLLTRYGDLPADDLVEVMALALAAIELRGRAEVLAGQ